jgi:hypothetical protein
MNVYHHTAMRAVTPSSPIARALARASALAPIAALTWLAACTVAVFLAVMLVDSAIIDGLYIPRSNDSLYHARRIVDAAVGSRGFYEFDERLHVPDGTWISWPWAYDYLLSRVAAFGVWLEPGSDPLRLVFYAPVAWILVNAGLFLAVSRAIRLSAPMQALAMLCFALSPLVQFQHAVGMLDHHYVEHTFVLLAVWLGIRWFEDLGNPRRAIALGAALGLAPAFHNGLFILQLLPLGTLFILWLRGTALPAKALRSFAIALLAVTQLILLPSEPYRRGMFEFGLLSWFHFYVAACTVAAVLLLAQARFTPRRLAVFFSLCAALVLPLAGQVAAGAGFLSKSFSILGRITEAQSPYTLFTTLFGPTATAGYYSWLLLAAPVLAAFFVYRVLRETNSARLYFALAAGGGLLLLLTQFRLHYFGWFALVMGPLLAVDALRVRFRWHAGATSTATFAALVVAFQPPLRDHLFGYNAPGSTSDYAIVLPLYLRLMPLCAEDPGVVLANSNDGSAVLFHTECSVIANNFILRPPDEAHIGEIVRLFRLPPEEIVKQRPDVKYFLVRARDFLVPTADGELVLGPDNAVAQQLLTNNEPPPGFELLKTVLLKAGPNEGDVAVFARLFKVHPHEIAVSSADPAIPLEARTGVAGEGLQ